MPLRIAESYANAIAASYAHNTQTSDVKKRSFWLRVQEAMSDNGIKPTQKAAAALIGIKQPSVVKWARGGLPSMEHVVTLSTKLGVCVEWLFTERGPKHPMTAETSYVVNAFSSLPTQRLKDKAVAYIDALNDRGPPETPHPPERRLS